MVRQYHNSGETSMFLAGSCDHLTTSFWSQ